MKAWIIRYRVKPIDNRDTIFPLDMLRYDSSRPTSQKDVGAMTHALFGRGGEWQKSDTIQLSHYEHGNKSWHPTIERWKSFSWEVVEVDPPAEYP